jgi:glutaredoxin
MRLLILICFCFLSALPPLAAAEKIYEWVDAEGRVHYSNQPKSSSKADNGKTHDWTDPRGRKIYSDRSRDQLNAERQHRMRNLECMSGLTEIIDNPKNSRRGKVILLTAGWCDTSKQARQYLKQNNIRFVEYDIDRSGTGRKLYLSLEQRGVPALLAGRQQMFGFREDLAEKVLIRSGHLYPN